MLNNSVSISLGVHTSSSWTFEIVSLSAGPACGSCMPRRNLHDNDKEYDRFNRIRLPQEGRSKCSKSILVTIDFALGEEIGSWRRRS